MPKRIDNIFYPKLKFKNMLEAYKRASDKKHYNKEVIIYEMDLASNLVKVLKELYSGTYKTSEYRSFTIYEPKERIIRALPFKDRVVQQWYVEEFIKPIFLPKFISDSYACIPTRGVHQAVHKLRQYAYNMSKKNKDFYFLKCDISKFFNNIDREVLYKIVKRYIKDKYFLEYTKLLIYSDKELAGIPIGNYTSQYFANIYLNMFDHYVKEVLKVKYYIRYMDDFAFVLNSKEECKEILEKVTLFLKEKLKLKLNKKTNYFKGKQGINFCGYRIFATHILLKKSNKKKMYKRLKNWNKLYDKKQLELKETFTKLASWEGHAKNADTFYLRKKVRKMCKWLYD